MYFVYSKVTFLTSLFLLASWNRACAPMSPFGKLSLRPMPPMVIVVPSYPRTEAWPCAAPGAMSMAATTATATTATMLVYRFVLGVDT